MTDVAFKISLIRVAELVVHHTMELSTEVAIIDFSVGKSEGRSLPMLVIGVLDRDAIAEHLSRDIAECVIKATCDHRSVSHCEEAVASIIGVAIVAKTGKPPILIIGMIELFPVRLDFGEEAATAVIPTSALFYDL